MSPKVVLASECLIETPRLGVYREQLRNLDGSEVERLRVSHPGAVVVAAFTDDAKIVLVKQYRHSVGIELLELPAGTLERDEEPSLCAKRELEEETGFLAELWQPMGVLYPAPGFCNEVQHLFVAEKLRPGTFSPESSEEIEVICVAISELDEMVRSEAIVDAKTLAALYRLKCQLPEKFR